MAHPHLGSPPCFVLDVPADRLLDTLFEGDRRLPIEQALCVTGVASVPKDLPWAMVHEVQRDAWHVHHLPDDVGDLNDADIAPRAQVDDLSNNLLARGM